MPTWKWCRLNRARRTKRPCRCCRPRKNPGNFWPSGCFTQRRIKPTANRCAVLDFVHKTVMAAEVLDALKPKPGGRYADGTLGGAGHAETILAASSPTGWLFGCDRDGGAVDAARRRLEKFEDRFELRQGNFADLAEWLPKESCDGVLLDLGVSSQQLDTGGRGFSLQHDGPLDMRMDTRQQLTAADLANTASAGGLANPFW